MVSLNRSAKIILRGGVGTFEIKKLKPRRGPLRVWVILRERDRE